MKTCETCRFWDDATFTYMECDKSYRKTCRAHSPFHDDRNGQGRWPMTEREDWCGDWKPARVYWPQRIDIFDEKNPRHPGFMRF